VDFPIDISTSPVVCSHATVFDATGQFMTTAVARKNPEVRPAFPSLRSPIRENTPIRFFLAPCLYTISDDHEDMQRQRLLFEGEADWCIDDWQSPGFEDTLVLAFRDEIDRVRTAGKDMVLSISLHRDEAGFAPILEAALARVLPPEQNKSSPRVTGAFIFDSYNYVIRNPEVGALVLWCPTNMPTQLPEDEMLDEDEVPVSNASERSCAILPDNPELVLGPFSFTNLPILPSRKSYLEFIEDYSEAQAGETIAISLLAPERTPTSANVSLGDYGTATFFNDEIISAAPGDAFSFCPTADQSAVVVRIEDVPDIFPLDYLPAIQAEYQVPTYQLGLAWDFPYLFRLDYEIVIAGSATAFSVSVPFGIASSEEAYYGTGLWLQDSFPIGDALAQCTRFCEHPTFDTAGVYNVNTPFNPGYAESCYRPLFPVPPGEGFPLDP
ncbi:hypothetical protein KAI87_00980, partial [Myxococcota bacterium]|nr:hypothetical protein [Myxococcota bacterium]